MSKYLIDNLDKHQRQIRNIVYRVAKEEGVVDDITQECCLKIIERKHLWDGNRSKLVQWINAVMVA